MITKITKMNSPWFSKKNYANVLAKLQKYQNLKALVYFLAESARHSKVVPSKTKVFINFVLPHYQKIYS